MLSIRECLIEMHSGRPFSLKVVSYDKRRKEKSGRLFFYEEAVLVWGDAPKSATPKGERSATPLEKSLMANPQHTRPPNHQWHYTRNIRILHSGVPTEIIVKIHPPLIVEFNGQPTAP